MSNPTQEYGYLFITQTTPKDGDEYWGAGGWFPCVGATCKEQHLHPHRRKIDVGPGWRLLELNEEVGDGAANGMHTQYTYDGKEWLNESRVYPSAVKHIVRATKRIAMRVKIQQPEFLGWINTRWELPKEEGIYKIVLLTGQVINAWYYRKGGDKPWETIIIGHDASPATRSMVAAKFWFKLPPPPKSEWELAFDGWRDGNKGSGIRLAWQAGAKWGAANVTKVGEIP